MYLPNIGEIGHFLWNGFRRLRRGGLGQGQHGAEPFGQIHVEYAQRLPKMSVNGPFLTRNAGRVGGWRASFGVRWRFQRFRAGPQSGTRDRVCRPPLIKPDVRISRIRLSDGIMPSPTEGPSWCPRGE